ncbi:MAG: type 4a pilus biogenesis protein PilO [Gammaproteobacteria bacterium]|nr:type 4a pilus biogenesis protein PilO [Gammaproteobacteria bacterium]
MKDINFDLNELDFSKVGSWPIAAKAGAIIVVCVLVMVLGYFFDIKGQQELLDNSRRQELTLKESFVEKWKKAANLEAYKLQMTEMEQSFGTMLRQLPSKTEIDDLLVDISQTGLASGINFKLFKPTKELHQDFYAEFPIQMEVTGDYHRFGRFVSGVAALPRIVTLHNIAIKREGKNKEDSSNMSMSITAKTYRYLDENEIAQLRAEQNKNRKKTR